MLCGDKHRREEHCRRTAKSGRASPAPCFALPNLAGALAVPFGALPHFAAPLRRITLQYPCFAVPGVASAPLYVAALCRGHDLLNYAKQRHSFVMPGCTHGLFCDASRCPCRARQCTASHCPACAMLFHAPHCRSLETAAQCQCRAMPRNARPEQVRRLCLATQCRRFFSAFSCLTLFVRYPLPLFFAYVISEKRGGRGTPRLLGTLPLKRVGTPRACPILGNPRKGVGRYPIAYPILGNPQKGVGVRRRRLCVAGSYCRPARHTFRTAA